MSASLFNDTIIQSALDLDVYKINMMFAARKYYPSTQVRYELIVRSKEDLSDLKTDVAREINQLANYRFGEQEISYLKNQATYLDEDFFRYLDEFRFKPMQQTAVSVVNGQLRVSISGIWHETILYETLVMSIISEVRNKVAVGLHSRATIYTNSRKEN